MIFKLQKSIGRYIFQLASFGLESDIFLSKGGALTVFNDSAVEFFFKNFRLGK